MFGSFSSYTIILRRYPGILNTYFFGGAVPEYLIGSGPTVSCSPVTAILYIDRTVAVDVVIERAYIPTLVRTCVPMCIPYVDSDKCVRTDSLAARNTVMASDRKSTRLNSSHT